MKSAIFLAQSDTTAGFLCKKATKIARIKQNNAAKKYLRESCDIANIKRESRIPRVLSKAIRRANRTTFIFPNDKSFRVARDLEHLRFLRLFGVLYSSSANLHNKAFNAHFAAESAEIIAQDSRGIFSAKASQIFKIRKQKLKRIR